MVPAPDRQQPGLASGPYRLVWYVPTGSQCSTGVESDRWGDDDEKAGPDRCAGRMLVITQPSLGELLEAIAKTNERVLLPVLQTTNVAERVTEILMLLDRVEA